MRLLHKIAIFQTVNSKVIISLFETVRLSVSISPRNLYNSLNSIKEKGVNCISSLKKDCALKSPKRINETDFPWCINSEKQLVKMIFLIISRR